MQVEISRAEIKKAVAGLSRVIVNKPTLPVLGCVRLDVNGSVTITATDLEQTARYTFTGSTATGTGSLIIRKELGSAL